MMCWTLYASNWERKWPWPRRLLKRLFVVPVVPNPRVKVWKLQFVIKMSWWHCVCYSHVEMLKSMATHPCWERLRKRYWKRPHEYSSKVRKLRSTYVLQIWQVAARLWHKSLYFLASLACSRKGTDWRLHVHRQNKLEYIYWRRHCGMFVYGCRQ